MRSVAVLMAALALMGGVERALSCNVNARLADCCPTGAEQPCDGMPADPALAADAVACCAAVPAPAQEVAADSSRARLSLDESSGSDDAGPVFAGLFPQKDATVAARLAFVLPPPYFADDSLTYLRTARLRL